MKTGVIFLVLGLACGLACADTSVAIALRPQARVAGPIVTLGDVALLQSTELEPVRTLANMPLGRSPAAGEAVTLRREAVAGWLRAKAGLAEGALLWSGPEATQLVTAVRKVSGEEVAAAAEAMLRGWLATHALRSDLQLQSLPRDFEAPEGELRFRPRVPDAAVLRSRMLAWVEVWVDGRFVRSVAVPFQVDAEGILPAPSEVATVLPASNGAAKSSGKAGGAAPVVLRGQWVALRSAAGAVALEARVEVLQDGRLGDSVRVRQQGADGSVIARVAGPGLLELAR